MVVSRTSPSDEMIPVCINFVLTCFNALLLSGNNSQTFGVFLVLVQCLSPWRVISQGYSIYCSLYDFILLHEIPVYRVLMLKASSGLAETQLYLELCWLMERHESQKGIKANSPCGI